MVRQEEIDYLNNTEYLSLISVTFSRAKWQHKQICRTSHVAHIDSRPRQLFTQYRRMCDVSIKKNELHVPSTLMGRMKDAS